MNLLESKCEKMLSLLAQWGESGLSQKEFCSFHGIKVCTLSYWIKKSSEQVEQGGFTEIRSSMVESGNIEVGVSFCCGTPLYG